MVDEAAIGRIFRAESGAPGGLTSLSVNMLSDANLTRVRVLSEIARRRGQSLAQLAIVWVLRDDRVTSALLGASSVEQLEANLAALAGPPLTDEELTEIDQYAVDSGVDLWEASRAAG